MKSSTTVTLLYELNLVKSLIEHIQRWDLNLRDIITACLWSSKAVVLILLWNLIISIGFESFFDPSLYSTITFNNIEYYNDDDDYFLTMLIYGLPYGLSALLFLFYPLAGFLADVCWGRYVTVKNGLCFLFWSIVTVTVMMAFGVSMLGSTTIFVPSTANYHYTTTEIIIIAVLCLVFGVPGLCGLMLCFSSIVAFSANVIQFGFDQLHDSPAESSWTTLYIHWYVWTNQVGLFLFRLPSAVFSGYDSIKYTTYAATPVLTLVALILLGITLCFEKYKRNWFLIEPSGSTNPYKLVYKVVKFAKDHTNPIRLSAFTYCEDELPSRLDLGKEDPSQLNRLRMHVKAFLGIIRVLLTIGPIFFADVVFGQNLSGLIEYQYYYSNNYHLDLPYYAYFYGSGCLTPLLMLVFIPVYPGLLRPLIYDYIPGMLKRIGLGMLLCLISGFCTLVMGVANYNC